MVREFHREYFHGKKIKDELDENRMRHSLRVAEKMADIAGDFHIDPKEAFALGLLHDLGYAFCVDKADHGRVGGLFLRHQGYRYWREVYYHGFAQDDYTSDALDLLNIADLTTGPNGEDFTIEERILDIKQRYGPCSTQVQNANWLGKKLGLLVKGV